MGMCLSKICSRHQTLTKCHLVPDRQVHGMELSVIGVRIMVTNDPQRGDHPDTRVVTMKAAERESMQCEVMLEKGKKIVMEVMLVDTGKDLDEEMNRWVTTQIIITDQKMRTVEAVGTTIHDLVHQMEEMNRYQGNMVEAMNQIHMALGLDKNEEMRDQATEPVEEGLGVQVRTSGQEEELDMLQMGMENKIFRAVLVKDIWCDVYQQLQSCDAEEHPTFS